MLILYLLCLSFDLCLNFRELGLSESLFVRLDSEVSTVSLTQNYRMNQAITDLANGLTYGGRLECGSENVATATLKLKSSQVCKHYAASLGMQFICKFVCF